MIPEGIHSQIVARLRQIEVDERVRVLFAIESGSRAWGFASPDSDYDIRFIYARRAEDYLRLDPLRDVIEQPIEGDIDLNGWDVQKALRLFWASNPAFVEWVQSPITYLEQGPFRAQVAGCMGRIYSFEKAIYHYRSMAVSNFKLLSGGQVKLKKYFYVLRPLLCVRWVEEFGTIPPMEFRSLLPLVSDAGLLQDIEALLERKASTPEIGLGAPLPRIHAFIESELRRLESAVPARHVREGTMDELNAIFRSAVADA